MPDFTKNFTIECDASNTGIVAVLLQGKHLVVFTSHGLKGKALSLSTYEKEMTPILWALKKEDNIF